VHILSEWAARSRGKTARLLGPCCQLHSDALEHMRREGLGE